MTEDELATIAVDAMIEVHRELGPGLLESSYEHCLLFELTERGLKVERQVALPLRYKKVTLEAGYRIDIWVERKLIIEVKSVETLHPIHLAQIITYLKLTDNRLGLLVNFNEKLVSKGIRRVANKMPE
ncbi:MAG: GxxExxY protein [Flavobacteriales bacterium]|jgi:GxxExxY protein|nr:GxxExxY protein [Flavobacteriales bacterium]MBP9160835.1 GxxExxY protein [Flavobacteriales bacterium]MCI1752096.1 GxxExxY protein [Flavobacteriales bacterium]